MVRSTCANLSAALLARVAGNVAALPEGVDPFPFEEVTGTALLLRRLNGLEASEGYLEALVDTILIPSLHATASRDSALPLGIFSGHPTPRATDTTSHH